MAKTCVIKINKVNGLRPVFDVYIGRYVQYQEFEKSKWANPYVRSQRDGARCIELYERYIRSLIKAQPEIYDLNELKGKKLGCWCVTTNKIFPIVCHGQVLMILIKEMERKNGKKEKSKRESFQLHRAI